jgi:hypothetical protein
MLARIGFVSVTLAGLLLVAAVGRAQERKEAAAGHEADKPGPVHKQLAKLAGDYTTVSRFIFKPGTPAQETTGTARITSILGGRFLSEEHSGTMLGQPVSGLHLTGYNNATGQYEASWVYTGSTAIMTLVGSSKDDGKTIEYTGSFEQQKGNRTTLFVAFHQVNENSFVVELSAKNPDGSKGPTLETTYTRKK